MTFTFTLTENAGKVRLLIPDKDTENVENQIFQDDEIEAFLTLEDDNVRRAAALAIETIASSEALTLKVIKLLDIQTDGAKTSDALLARAAKLREQATEAEEWEEDGAFDIAEMVVDDFSARERIIKQALRDE